MLLLFVLLLVCLFFFKQKTAYELRISDWSSDVCSSDLFLAVVAPLRVLDHEHAAHLAAAQDRHADQALVRVLARLRPIDEAGEIGRASCRERVCQYV